MASTERIAGAASLFLLAAAAGLGCGGDGETTALTRTDFVTRADAICRQASSEFDEIQSTAASTPEAAERQVGALIGVSEQALDDLRQIAPPAALQSKYERYLAARERALGYLEDGRDAAADRNAEAYLRAKRRVGAEQATRLQLARAVGLKDCSRPSITFGKG